MHRVYPQFKQFGSLTGRLSGGGGFSIHQQPKSEGYFRCWRAEPGRVWISLDFKSVEDVILAESTRDPALLKLYGPEANPAQDAYLFTGAQLPIIGKTIRAAGYDPDDNSISAEVINRVKKECARERKIAKTLKLGLNYGAGPAKLRETLALEGVDISVNQARTLHTGYWELYREVKVFEHDLKLEWERNGGYVLNGIGRPVCCHVDKLKDIISRYIQSTAHDIQMMHIQILTEILQGRGIPFSWVVVDWHDQLIIEVDETSAKHIADVMRSSVLSELNRRLGGYIPIRGEPEIGSNLYQVK